MTPPEQLTRAVLDLVLQGQRPRCSDPVTHELWTSDNREEREQAAAWCQGCPLLEVCAEAGAGEAWGVWGGVDAVPLRSGQARAVSR